MIKGNKETPCVEVPLYLFLKHKVHGSQNEGKRNEVIPPDGFFQVKNGKEGKDGERNNFLDGFELKAGKTLLFPDPVGRHLKTVFKKGNAPADKDDFPEGHVSEFQVTIPGEGHECVGDDEKDNGTHAANLLRFKSENQEKV